MTWSAHQYVAFEDERTRPVRDLLAAAAREGVRSALDVGCGPGNSTEVLAARYPAAWIEGFDNSPDMIEAARKRMPNAYFQVAELHAWLAARTAGGARASGPRGTGGLYDLILANASLQWVPDHVTLFPALLLQLAPAAGVLAVQVPDNLHEPAHLLMRAVAREGPWREKLADAERTRVHIESADWYYQLLKPTCTRVDVWRTTYFHALAGGESAIVEWFKGTGLRPFLEPLDDAERAAFLARYTAEIKRAYPPQAEGAVLLPFPRLFIVATR